MAQSRRILLFGDQTYDFAPKLRELLSVKDNPILTAFFEQAHYVVRAQMIRALDPREHKAARTSGLVHMLQKFADGKLSSAFQTPLSCITQIGSFMRYLHILPFNYHSDHVPGSLRIRTNCTHGQTTAMCLVYALEDLLQLLLAPVAHYQSCFPSPYKQS